MPIWALQLLLGIAFQVASTLIQQNLNAQRAEKSKAAPTGLRGQYETGDVQPKSFVLGTIGLPGKLEYENSWGTVGETPRAYLTRVFSFGDVPVDGFDHIYVNGMETTKVGTGAVDQGYPVPEYADGGTDHLWWIWHDGSQTTADAYLVDKYEDDEVYAWDADYIGRGVPYIIMSALWNRVLWGGKFPDFMVQVRGLKLYDPRKDTTAGGSGTHRADDQSTWEFSDNPMVIVYNIVRLGIWWDSEWMWGRRTPLSAARFPYSDWSAAMNECDVEIALVGGGTERQFRVGRDVKVNERPVDVVNRFLAACNGEITVVAGVYYPVVGTPVDPVVTITDDDVIVTESAGLGPFPAFERIVNGATAVWLDPEEAWERKEAEPYYRPDLEALDRDQQLVETLRLEDVFSGTQAQRLLQSKVNDGRRFLKHAVYLRPEYKRLRPTQVIAWNSDHNAYSGKEFEIMSRAIRPDGLVLVSIREIDPTDHAWDPETDEQDIVHTPLVPQLPAPQPMSGWSVAPHTIVDSGSAPRRPAILVTFTGGLQDVRAVRIQAEIDGDIVFDGEIPYDFYEVSPTRVLSGSWCVSNQEYTVRGIFLPFSARETEWSADLTVTTPDVKLSDADVDIGSAIVASEVLATMGGNIRELRALVRETGSMLSQVDRENFTERGLMSVDFERRIGDAVAGFSQIIEISVSPMLEAMATRIDSIYVALGGNSAEINTYWTVQATEAGYGATYALQLAVDDGDLRAATMFADVPVDPGDPTRWGFMADQFGWFTTGGDFIAGMNADGHFRSNNGAIDIDMLTGDIIAIGNFSFGA